MFLEFVKISIVCFAVLIVAVLIAFFGAIFIKEQQRKQSEKAYLFWFPKVLEFLNTGKLQSPQKALDKKTVLQILLEQAEKQNVSKQIEQLGLDILLVRALKKNSNKILAMKNIGLAKIPQSFSLLKMYWESEDFDESYFSLYYTLEMLHTEQQNKEVLLAILKAGFNNERKVEMIRRLELPNTYLVEQIAQESLLEESKAILIAALSNAQLTAEQIKTIDDISHNKAALQVAFVWLLIQDSREQAVEILREYITPKMPLELRIEVAYRLSQRQTQAHFELLKQLIFDQAWEVRYHTALNLLKYNEQGVAYLQQVFAQDSFSDAGKMAQLHLAINPV